MYKEPTKYEVLRDNWLKKQTNNIKKFYAVFEKMTHEQRIEVVEDMQNLIEWREAIK